jgi:amino acid adenylation domain-containing protein
MPLLQHYVTAHADRRPDATAIVAEHDRVSYGALERRSNQIARLLKELGCLRGDRVCLLAQNSPAAIAGILGTLKADATYVPLDAGSPAARLARIVESSEPRWLLAAGSVAELLEELLARLPAEGRPSVGWLDETGAVSGRGRAHFTGRDVALCPSTPLPSRNDADALAYILYTSGSTGTPKGVPIRHRSVMHFVEWAVRYFGIDESDRLSAHAPLHFDLSTFDLYGAFLAGAELHIVPPSVTLLPQKTAAFIRDSRLTQWFSVPSALAYLARFDVVRQDDFPSLRRLLWCGEVFPTSALMYWMQRLPHVRFTNLYGPTETTVASAYYTLPECPADSRASTPIGQACDGEELVLFGENGQPVAPGEIGEIHIGGVGLSPGYWRDPERTAAAFIRDPRTGDPMARLYKTGDLGRLGRDGLMYFVGRSDSQIKSRGYRIELGEIEAALNALEYLQECAVVAPATSGFEGRTICCAYAAVSGQTVTPAQLRRDLLEVLPAHMMPARWVGFERLPKNVNGKIDRRQLTEYFENHESAAAG